MLSRARRSAVALCALSILALIALPGAALAGVLVVDISGGGEFTSLPAAIAAAVDGDTILIRPGDYSGQAGSIVINALALTVAADGTGPVLVPTIAVTNVFAPERVVLRGLTAHASATSQYGSGLTVTGEAFAEGCDFLGGPGGVFTGTVPGSPGVIVIFGSVVLKDCVAKGGKGFDTTPTHELASPGGPGVSTFSGNATIYGGHLIGGDGGDIFGYPQGAGPGPNAGGPALRVGTGVTFVAGSLLTGGTGGNGDEQRHESYKYAGGDGIRVDGPQPVRVLGLTIQPGVGGFDGNGVQGAPGEPVKLVGQGAAMIVDPGPFRDYALDGPTSEGDPVHLSYSGVAGDTLAIFISTQSINANLPGKQGVWHLGAPLFGPYLLSAPTGTLSLNIPVPSVGLGQDGALLLFEQCFIKPAAGPALLSSPSTHLIVDDSL